MSAVNSSVFATIESAIDAAKFATCGETVYTTNLPAFYTAIQPAFKATYSPTFVPAFEPAFYATECLSKHST